MRREDWWERLQAVVEHHGRLPVLWGTSDCAVLLMDAVQAVTGVDHPYLDDRGEYSSQAEATRLLVEKGFRNVGEALAAVLEEIPVSLARRGDVGVVRWEHGVGGVVFVGRYAVAKNVDGGTILVPRSSVSRAFKVE